MSDFIDFIRMIILLIQVIFHTIVFFIGLWFVPYFVWKHYDDQKKRSVEMAHMAKKLGMQLDRPLNRGMDKVHRFLRKVKGSRRYALNVISGQSQGHSVTIFEYHYQRYFKCKSYEFSKYIEHNYISYFVLDLENEFPVLTVKEERPASKVLARIADAWSNIDTELKRRYELIPNLVAAIRGYATYERETLEKVTEIRNTCMADHGSASHQEGTEKQLVVAVQRLLAVAEAYPDLKADKNFLQLQHELVNTEDRIQAARRFYNGNVRDYENRRESFPGNLVANLFKFEPQDFFNVDPAVRAAPSIAGAF